MRTEIWNTIPEVTLNSKGRPEMVPWGSPKSPPGAWDGVQPLPRPQEAARSTHGTRGLLLPAWSKEVV